MSTSKHFDIICIVVIIIALVASLVFMIKAPDVEASSGISMEYESRIFDDSVVHTIDIEMDDWEAFIDTCQSEEYSPCNITIDGETYDNVGIRGKGNTSLTNVSSLGSDRYSFKVEFDHYDDSLSYYGLDKLCLNNLIQDNTLMKDYLTYQLMGEFGVSSPLTSYVYITVNGEDWGLYLATEAVEESFMERNYGSDYGNLYKPDTASNGGGSEKASEMMDAGEIEFDGDMPDGTEFDGEMPEMPEDTEFSGEMPEMPDGTEFSGEMPEMPDGTEFEGEMPDDAEVGEEMSDDAEVGGEMPEMPDGEDNPAQPDGNSEVNSGNMGTNNGGMNSGVMGNSSSNAVKLQYIDDDADSYSDIFDNAKTDITDSDKETLISSLENLSSYSNLTETVDIEKVMRYFVVHNFVCNGDSYTGSMIHNYYLYEDDGVLSMIPWDYNLAFGGFQGNDADSVVNESIDEPISDGSVDDRPMFGWIMSDEEYTDEYHELYQEFLDNYINNEALLVKIEKTRELISEYVEKDPTKFCTTEEFETAVDTLEEFVKLRGQAISNQLSGSDEQVDASDISISAMGSMNAGNARTEMPDDSKTEGMNLGNAGEGETKNSGMRGMEPGNTGDGATNGSDTGGMGPGGIGDGATNGFGIGGMGPDSGGAGADQ